MKVYWNNICLISRFEKQYIENKLDQEGLSTDFQFEYFGIGREQEIVKSVQRDLEEDALPDIIVATESDLFHVKEGLLDKQELLANYVPWTLRENLPYVSNPEKFKPMLYIPLVMIVNKENVENVPQSIEEVLANPDYEGQITFGGIDNAAGKTLLATVEYLYGKEKSEQLLNWSVTTNMPVGAFKNVVEGKSKIGFVPTIFAMRAEVSGIEMVWPREGAIVIPSFIAIREGADLHKVSELFQKIITPDFIQQISTQSGVIPCVLGTGTIDIFKDYEEKIVYPSWGFIRQKQTKEQMHK